MAILSKIRDRSVALIAVVGLALFAFVLDPSTLQDFFNSTKINEVGTVDGEPISRQQYAEAVDNYRNRGRGFFSEMQAARRVWDDLVKEKIYNTQLEKAGITIGENDVWDRMITLPAVTGSPSFQNEAGIFDENKFKLFLKTAQENDQPTYKAWELYMSQIKAQILNETYNNLLNAGIGASLKEGERQYFEEGKSIDASYVYIPFSSIPDSLVTIKKSDIDKYTSKRASLFEVEASRDITYVRFDIKPTDADKDAIKKEVASVLEDKQIYNKVSKQEETSYGLKNTTNYVEFFDDNISDIAFDDSYKLKEQLPKSIADDILKGKANAIFGPYEDANMFKLSKIIEIKQMPDSVKSSHILIPFVGALRATADAKTKEAAKKSADSILKLVRRNKKKFAAIADEINTDGTKGKGGDIGWTSFNIGFSPRFDAAFAAYIFNNRKGNVAVVESKFGYHVIRVDEVKNMQPAVKLATFGKTITASQATETSVFQAAETFALEVSKDKSKFTAIAKEKNYEAKPAHGLKMFDDNVPGIGVNREIINWIFDKDVNIDDYKRFDIDNGFVVAVLTAKDEAGIMSAVKANSRVRPRILNEKKAAMLADKFKNVTSLDDLAKNNNVQVNQISGVNLKAPSLTGVGLEPNVVGAMYNAVNGKLYAGITGNKGVFAFVVNKSEMPAALPNYDSYRNRITQQRKNSSFLAFQALKKKSEIEDNRATFYGINQ